MSHCDCDWVVGGPTYTCDALACGLRYGCACPFPFPFVPAFVPPGARACECDLEWLVDCEFECECAECAEWPFEFECEWPEFECE